MSKSDTRQVDEDVVGDIDPIHYGNLCECGHLNAIHRPEGRLARLELRARNLAHRLRHPFHEQQPPREWIAELPDPPDFNQMLTEGFTFNYDE